MLTKHPLVDLWNANGWDEGNSPDIFHSDTDFSCFRKIFN